MGSSLRDASAFDKSMADRSAGRGYDDWVKRIEGETSNKY